MNRRGFTLIELLMVIAIIAILSLILIPNVVVLKNKNAVKSCQSLEKNIISSAKMYISDNKYNLGFSCDGVAKKVSLQALIDNDYLKGPIVNPSNNENIALTEEIAVTYDCNTKSFDYTFSLGC